MRTGKASQFIALLFAIGVTACHDSERTGPEGAPSGPRKEEVRGQGATAELLGEQLFSELSLVAPSSAGFAYEGLRLVAYVADEKDSRAAETFVRLAVQQGRILPPGGGRRIEGISSRKVRHSYAQLSDYRSRIEKQMLGKDVELQFIDLDEVANAVTLGYSGDSSSFASRVKAEVSLSHVDQQLVRIVRVGRAKPIRNVKRLPRL